MALHAVKPSDSEVPASPKSITEAASAGTRRELLAATRDRIAKAIESPDCPPRDLASLTRRIMEIAKEIEAIDLAAAQEAGKLGSMPDEAFDASAI